VPVAETPWQQLLHYVISRKPDFPLRARGAAPHEIERLVACCPRPIPSSVVELHATLGHGSEIFWPFNKRFLADIDALLDDIENQWVADRFFRVAIELDDQDLDPADLYVDLESSNGYDAALLQLPGEWDGREPHARCHTLMSKAISCAFFDFDIAARGEHGSLGHYMSIEEFPKYVEAMSTLAARMGLDSVFRPRDDLQCYANDALSVLFDAIGPGVPPGIFPGEELPSGIYLDIWIGTTNLAAFQNVGAQIRDAMPPLQSFTRRLVDSCG
jgi:hypothetical protein